MNHGSKSYPMTHSVPGYSLGHNGRSLDCSASLLVLGLGASAGLPLERWNKVCRFVAAVLSGLIPEKEKLVYREKEAQTKHGERSNESRGPPVRKKSEDEILI